MDGKQSLRPLRSRSILQLSPLQSWHSTGSSRDFHLREKNVPPTQECRPGAHAQHSVPTPTPARCTHRRPSPHVRSPQSLCPGGPVPPAREGCRRAPRLPPRPPASPQRGRRAQPPEPSCGGGARGPGGYLHDLALGAEHGPGPREAAREAGGVGGVVAARARLEQHHLHERRLLGPRRAGPRGRQQQPEKQRQRRRRRQATTAGAAAEATAAAARGPWAPARAWPHGPAAGGRGGRARPGIVAGRRRTERLTAPSRRRRLCGSQALLRSPGRRAAALSSAPREGLSPPPQRRDPLSPPSPRSAAATSEGSG